MKNLISGLILLASTLSFASEGYQYIETESMSHEERKEYLRLKNISSTSSYSYQIMNDVPRNVTESLSHKCKQFLNDEVYKKKSSLYSTTIFDASKRADSYSYKSKINDLQFFHYTKAEQMLDDLKGINPERFTSSFKYLRTSRPELKMWSSMLYVAEDPNSSKDFGDLRVEFTLMPSTRILELYYDIDLEVYSPYEMIGEIEEKHPGFKSACLNTEKKAWCCGKSAIRFLIFEDSGIGLVDYYDRSDENYNEHFQLITPYVIKDVDLKY